jgi:uncharacterized protein YecE (DUF72 family)
MPANHPKAWKPVEPPPDITAAGFYVGVAGYDFDDWAGRFYSPSRARESKARSGLNRLTFYQTYFPFVEIHHTFEDEPQIGTFLDIEKHSAESIRYAVRVHRQISHVQKPDTKSAVDLMRRQIQAVSPLVESGRFYTFLIQLEDRVLRSQKRLDYLVAVASEAVRQRLDVHIEFRHVSWHHVYPIQVLKDNGIGICNTELAPAGSVFPLKAYATTDKGYIRYNGLKHENGRRRAHTTHKTGAESNGSQGSRDNDYLYSEGEIEKRVTGQVTLSKKVSNLAIVYANCARAQAVINAVQNIRQLKQLSEFASIRSP